MRIERLVQIIDKFPAITLAVIGDYFLDKYLIIDEHLAETSIETGLAAHQVVGVRMSPGAAGTVASNLSALGANVIALGFIGDDGDGIELERGLRAFGADVTQLLRIKDFFTQSYTKPMVRTSGGEEHELSRLDVKNRKPVSDAAEAELIGRLRAVLPYVQGVVVVDQVEQANCGALTESVRSALCGLAAEYPDRTFAAESRSRIGLYRRMILKPNASEAAAAIGLEATEANAPACAQGLFLLAGGPVFMTRGADGVLLCDENGIERIQTVEVAGPIDIVGAGDSALAAIAVSVCAGASRLEAALLGNLAASVTIRQIGTTGTASPAQVIDAFGEWEKQRHPLSRSAQSSSVQSSNEASSRPSPLDTPRDL